MEGFPMKAKSSVLALAAMAMAFGTGILASGVSQAKPVKATQTTTAVDLYFGASGWSDLYVYTWKTGDNSVHSMGTWPGAKVTTNAAMVNYQGLGLYKVHISISTEDHVLFSVGSNVTQTPDLVIQAGHYYHYGDANADGAESGGDLDKGSGAQVVYDINAARGAVTANAPILAGSVCGITKGTATTLVSEFDALNDTAKGYVNSATVYTYQYDDTANSMNVPYSSVVAQLRRTVAASPAIVTPFSTDSVSDPFNAGTVIGIVMIAALGALSAIFIIRKKKLGD